MDPGIQSDTHSRHPVLSSIIIIIIIISGLFQVINNSIYGYKLSQAEYKFPHPLVS